MLAHRLRRWPNNEPTLYERLVFAGNYQHSAERRDVPVVECDLNPPARVKVAQMVDKTLSAQRVSFWEIWGHEVSGAVGSRRPASDQLVLFCYKTQCGRGNKE